MAAFKQGHSANKIAVLIFCNHYGKLSHNTTS